MFFCELQLDYPVIGNTVTFVWYVLAGDGVGAVTAAIDPTGGTNFNVPLPLTGPIPGTVGSYTFSATVPSVTCTGASTDGSKLCSIQFQSTSAWYSCTSVEILTTGTQTVSIPKKCVYPSVLKFCDMINGQNVLIPDVGQDLAAYDVTLKNNFYATLYNPAVFNSPNTSACGDYFKKLYCGINYPLCSAPNDGGCGQTCEAINLKCGVTELHKPLFECNTSYTNRDKDATGVCSQVFSFGYKNIISVSLLMMILFLIF